MIRRPPRSTPLYSSAASDVYKRQMITFEYRFDVLPGKLKEYEKYTKGPGKDIWLKFKGVNAVRIYKSMLGGSSPQRLVQVDLSLIHISEPTRLRRTSY